MAEAWIGQSYVSTASVTVGGTPVAATAGYYYLVGYTGEGTDQALEHLASLIDSVVGAGLSTISVSMSTGLVTVAFGATSTLAWGDSELKTICGFESDIASSTGATGTLPAKGLWLPSRDAADYPLDKEGVWSYESTTRTVRATDGTAYTLGGSTSAARADIAYRLLTRDEVVRDGTERGTLEQYWHDVATDGLPMRYLPDSSSYAATTDYATGVWEMPEDRNAFTDVARRSIDGYDGLWDVDIPLIKYSA